MNEHVFHFLRPWWFVAIIPLIFLLWRMSKQALDQKDWTGIIDESLLPYVLVNKAVIKRPWSSVVMGFVGFLAITALAGPVWKQLPQPVFRNDAALVIAVDLSRSMNAADLKPNRLVRARFKIADLLKQRKEGQTALLAYAGDAFTVTPLTDDTQTILSQLKALSTDLMPVQGSRADRAMIKASELLKQAGHRKGEVLLITDGVDLERDEPTAKSLLKEGYRLMILGIGTNEGAPIPDSQGGFYSDASGNIVIPTLDNTSLKSLAKAGGGYYQQYTQLDRDVNNLTSKFDLDPTKSEASESESEMKSDQWQEEGVWILLLIIPFAAFAFRKGYLVIAVFLINGLTFSEDSLAVDLWLTADQKAKQLLESGETEQAAEIFENQQWKGSAQYKAEDYEAALESWKEDQSNVGLYNKGNALAKSGKLEEALESYKTLLEKDPGHEDAQYNYEQVKKALEQQQDQEQEGKDQQSDQDKKSEEGGGSEDEKGQQSESDDAAENDQQSSSDDKKNDQQKEDQSSDQDEEKKDDQDKADKEKDGEEASGEQQDEQNKPAEEDDKDIDQADQDESTDEESQQAVEAALRAIPDDPGGLLRRKFKYQYQRQATQAEVEEQQW